MIIHYHERFLPKYRPKRATGLRAMPDRELIRLVQAQQKGWMVFMAEIERRRRRGRIIVIPPAPKVRPALDAETPRRRYFI